MKTLEAPRCLRSGCRFTPLPALTEADALEVFAYCSMSCKELMEAALVIARCEPSPETERRSHQLVLINQLLDLRSHAAEYDEAKSMCGVLDGR